MVMPPTGVVFSNGENTARVSFSTCAPARASDSMNAPARYSDFWPAVICTPATIRFFMSPDAISFASVASLRKQATLTVLSTVEASSSTRAIRRSCSAVRTRHDAVTENSSPMTTARTRIDKLVRATMLRGSAAPNHRGSSGLDFKHHLHLRGHRGTVDVRDRVRVALHQLERGLAVGHLEGWRR